MTPDWPGDTTPLPHQAREDGVGRRVREMARHCGCGHVHPAVSAAVVPGDVVAWWFEIGAA